MSHKTACDKGLEWTRVDCCYQNVEDYPRGFPNGSAGKEFTSNAGDVRDTGPIPGSGRSPRGGHGDTPVFLPEESHGQRSLAVYSPKGRKKSDMAELLSTYTHIPED